MILTIQLFRSLTPACKTSENSVFTKTYSAFSACLVSNISLLYSPGSGADGWSTHSGEKGQPGDVTLEESGTSNGYPLFTEYVLSKLRSDSGRI